MVFSLLRASVESQSFGSLKLQHMMMCILTLWLWEEPGWFQHKSLLSKSTHWLSHYLLLTAGEWNRILSQKSLVYWWSTHWTVGQQTSTTGRTWKQKTTRHHLMALYQPLDCVCNHAQSYIPRIMQHEMLLRRKHCTCLTQLKWMHKQKVVLCYFKSILASPGVLNEVHSLFTV